MMKDWTDIFAEGLKDIEETLPADDWTFVQQKYAAARRRRRAVLWSAVSGVAAVLAVFAVLLSRESASEIPLMADKGIPSIEKENPTAELENLAGEGDLPQEQEVVPEDISGEVPESIRENTPDSKPESSPVPRRKPLSRQRVEPREDVLVAEADGDEIDVVRDALADQVEVLVADNQQDASSLESVVNESVVNEPVVNEPAAEWEQDEAGQAEVEQGDWIEGKERELRSPRHRRISVGVSGASAFAGGSMVAFDKVLAPDSGPSMMEPMPDPPIYEPDEPADTSSLTPSAARARLRSSASMPATRSDCTLLSENYDHNMPVSYGLSARFTLTKRFSLNTGLNYTLYTSSRTRKYSDGSVENDRQSVHYLGIPLRADWMLIDRPRFGMYIGVGTQVDKCIYAKVGDERLYEDAFLWSLGGALGVQYNLTPALSLYAEPELASNFGYSRIYTHRDDAQFVVTARFGLRVNL